MVLFQAAQDRPEKARQHADAGNVLLPSEVGASLAFESDAVASKKKDDEPESAELYEQIGRLKVELEWLKKKVAENS